MKLPFIAAFNACLSVTCWANHGRAKGMIVSIAV